MSDTLTLEILQKARKLLESNLVPEFEPCTECKNPGLSWFSLNTNGWVWLCEYHILQDVKKETH